MVSSRRCRCSWRRTSAAYFGGALLLSVIDRRRRGKPLWYDDPPAPLFKERFASGYSHRTWYAKAGGARNALVVIVTHEALIVRPLFPFHLFFRLPELLGLEHTIPAARLGDVTPTEDAPEVAFENVGGEAERLTLRLSRRDDFLKALSALS
jgi:hypothetical protein